MGLREKSIKGVMWSGFSQGSRQVIQLVITVILARLLSPDDFGLVAMADVLISFLAIFTEMGLSSALIHKQDINERHINSAFWINLLFGIVLACLFLLSAPLISNFYHSQKLRLIVNALSINLIISSFGIIQLALLTKKMEFKKIAVRDVTAVSISGVAAIYFAAHGMGVWSLVLQSIILTSTNTLLLWVVSDWRPRFVFSISSLKEILPFSTHLTGFNIVNYFARNIDRVLIGKFLGSEALGIYSLAYKLMLVPLQNVSWIISKVMFPALSAIQHDLEGVRVAYQKMCKAISLITFPMMFGLFSLAPELVTIVFGSKWEPSIVIIRILCICGLFQSIHTTSGTILLSQGRSDIQLRLGLFSSVYVAVAIAIGIGILGGINGVAIMYTLEQILWILYAQNVTNAVIGMTLNSFLPPLNKTFSLSFLMALGIFCIKFALSFGENILFFAVYIVAGCILYAYLLIKFDYSEVKAFRMSVRHNA